MNCFDFLGIPHDSDKSTIKKAYSKLVKIYSPEKNPTEYEKLREAYDEALKRISKNTNLSSIGNFEDKSKENSLIDLDEINNNDLNLSNENSHWNFNELLEDVYEKPEVNYNTDPLLEIFETIEKSNPLFKEKFLTYLELASALEDSETLRNDFDYWEKLLKDPLLWDLEASSEISKLIFTFFTRYEDIKYCFLILANKHFRWDTKRDWLCNFFNESKINLLINLIESFPNLNYEDLVSLSNHELIEYIRFKNHCLLHKESLSISNMKSLKNYYAKLFNDYQLNYLIGKTYYNIGNYKEASSYLKKSLNKKNDYEYSRLTLGQSLYFLGEEKLAKENILFSYGINNRAMDTLHALAFLEYTEGNFNKAQDYLLNINKINKDFFEKLSKDLFKDIEKKKKRKKSYKKLIDPYKIARSSSKCFGIDTITLTKWLFIISILIYILEKLEILN